MHTRLWVLPLLVLLGCDDGSGGSTPPSDAMPDATPGADAMPFEAASLMCESEMECVGADRGFIRRGGYCPSSPGPYRVNSCKRPCMECTDIQGFPAYIRAACRATFPTTGEVTCVSSAGGCDDCR